MVFTMKCCCCSTLYLIIICLLFCCPATEAAQNTLPTLPVVEPDHDQQTVNLDQEKYRKLFLELEQKYQFQPAELKQIFQGLKFSQRVLELMDKQFEKRPYYEYVRLFLTPKMIQTGKRKLLIYKDLLARIERQFGVEPEIIVAIWGIETRYGANQGSFPVLETLNTLFAAYPQRAKFFRNELIQFLILCREHGIDMQTVKGSYAGAFGQAQFMPSSFRRFSVSFDGNDQCDLWHSVPDALASIANYIKLHGWKNGTPVYAELGNTLKDHRLQTAMDQGRKGRIPWQVVWSVQTKDLPLSPHSMPLSVIGLELDPKTSEQAYRYVAGYPNFHTITEYNHSLLYGMAVSELAEQFKKLELHKEL
ncbi:MAG: lytic transglycosylase [Candidatus Electrothrix sp. AW2]|nr:lytic transglycosylase [Candidatus Electrothrix gigas]